MALSDLAYHTEVLSNGMKVVLVKHPAAQAVKMKLVVRAGAFYETRATAGLSHFVEHLLLQQTPPGSLDGLDGITHDFTTEFRLTTSQDRLTPALTDLKTCLNLSSFDQDHLETARALITEEFASYSCDEILQRRLFEVARKKIYRNALEITETIESRNTRRLPQVQAVRFFQQHYGAQNLSLCLIGDVETSYIEIIRELFNTLPSGTTTKPPLLHLRTLPWVHSKWSFHRPARCLLTFVVDDERAANLSDGSFVDFWMLDTLLQGRLKSQLCGKLSLLYDCEVEYRATPQTGFFDIEFHGDGRNVHRSLQQIAKGIKRLLDNELSDEEMEYYRGCLQDECLEIYSSLDRLEDQFGMREVYDLPTRPLHELNQKLQMVDKNTLLDLARQTFRRDAVALVILSAQPMLKGRLLGEVIGLFQ